MSVYFDPASDTVSPVSVDDPWAGWLDAYTLPLASPALLPSRIVPGLWIGSGVSLDLMRQTGAFPEFGALVTLSSLGDIPPQGVLEFKTGSPWLDEFPLSRDMAAASVSAVLDFHARGFSTLVRCRDGLTQSCLVSVLALMQLTGDDFTGSLARLRLMYREDALRDPLMFKAAREYASDLTFWEQVQLLSTPQMDAALISV